MIPGYLNDLHLPCVFGTNSNAVDRHILETTKNEHIVDSETLKVSGFVSATFGQQEESLLKYFSVCRALVTVFGTATPSRTFPKGTTI